jgi:SAM-dependent methyltransferase
VNAAEYQAMYRLENELWWYVGMRRISAALLDGWLPSGARILDAGCGTGGNLQWLARYGTACGVDLSAQAISYCARRRLPAVGRGSVLELPFGDASFDLVTSFDVVYHLDVEDDVAALAEMRRVLRPGGWLLVRVPAFEQLRSRHDAAVHTRQRYRLAELERKTQQVGLAVRRSSYANTLLFPAAVVSRLLAHHRTEDEASGSDVRPVAPLLNAALGGVLALEAMLLARIDLPVGLSAIVLAQRPEASRPA